jgi:hypothetical protein
MEEKQISQFIQTTSLLDKLQSNEDVNIARTQNIKAKKLIDICENLRLEATREIMQSKKKIDDLWKERENPLKKIIEHNKSLMQEYILLQEKQTQAEIKKEGFSQKEAKELASIDTKVNSDISYRIDYDIKVLDINKVPERYLVKEVNEKLVKEAYKSNGKAIKGLSIKEIKTIITK